MAENQNNDNDPLQLQRELDPDNKVRDDYEKMMQAFDDLNSDMSMSDMDFSPGGSFGGSGDDLFAGQDQKAENHNKSSSPSPGGMDMDKVVDAVAEDPEMLVML